jgi:hypothetical protein
VAVLCHDPRLDMFRFMNIDDYNLEMNTMGLLSRSVTCGKKTAR